MNKEKSAKVKKKSNLMKRVSSIKKKLPKLVRDKVPEHIIKDDLVPIYRYASKDEYITLLQNKLKEEFNEFLEPLYFSEFMKGDYSELADVLDVLDALLKATTNSNIHVGSLDIATCRRQKAIEKGRFEQRIVLEDIKSRRELK